MGAVIFVGTSYESWVDLKKIAQTSNLNKKYSKVATTYRSLEECRHRVADVGSWSAFHSERQQGFVYDAKTGKLKGMIKGDGWYFFRDGMWYHRFINKGGKLDSRYPARPHPEIKIDPDSRLNVGRE